MNTSIFSGICFFILQSPWLLYITGVADVKDMVVCIGVRYTIKNVNIFPHLCPNTYSWGNIFLQKTLHFILYLCTFSLSRKGSVFKTYFELHAVIMFGDYIVPSIGKSTTAWFSLTISKVFFNPLTSVKVCSVLFYSTQLTYWDLLVLKSWTS